MNKKAGEWRAQPIAVIFVDYYSAIDDRGMAW